MTSRSRFPPLPSILVSGNGGLPTIGTPRPTVDDQLCDLYGDPDDFWDEPATLLDVPIAAIFFESPEDNKLHAHLPVCNKTDKLILYSVYASSPLFKMKPSFALLKGKECAYLHCSTDPFYHAGKLDLFTEGHLTIQTMEYPSNAAKTSSALRALISKNMGNPNVETHRVKKLLFWKSPRGFPPVMEVMSAFGPPPTVGNQVQNIAAQAEEPTWYDLEENCERMGQALKPATVAIRGAVQYALQRKRIHPKPARPSSVVDLFDGIPDMAVYNIGAALVVLLGIIVYVMYKFLST